MWNICSCSKERPVGIVPRGTLFCHLLNSDHPSRSFLRRKRDCGHFLLRKPRDHRRPKDRYEPTFKSATSVDDVPRGTLRTAESPGIRAS